MYGELLDETVSITIAESNQKAISLNQKSYFGKLENNVLDLSLIEALYLLEKNRLKVYQNEESIQFDDLKKIVRERDLYSKYLVFRDLKDRGYIIKAGFKYGSEFRLYERGNVPGKGHSEYLVKILHEFDKLEISNISSYARVAHGVKKRLLLAVIDEDGDLTYYKIKWTRP
ncbi:tRNA-intron lyase [Methanobrevibacter filiformis]|uniref:tRNA-splicing endonuclease subunit alpha n=1 Tax=Methanobrevibacter filiformis TaxID=55758 RepID=A0A166ET67_9EURY|nr:tRNA-intron lyase [Methanobrevibacter filiformis]KZX16985.1 tRNA-splicing endonuclease subunit alpha [Methanobrevibacter filiformis]